MPINKADFRRFEAGIKGGFERGFDNDAAQKLVIAPYIQFNISPKVAIMAQPGIKYATISTKNVGNPTTYYKENNDSSAVQNGNYTIKYLAGEGGSGTIPQYTTPYTYSQSHDSIIKSSSVWLLYGGRITAIG